MGNIIALRGRSNSGKSATIRLLHQLLVQNGYNVIETTLPDRHIDFTAIFEKKGKKIGVTSMGDDYKIVHNKLKLFINQKECNICICACRSFDRFAKGTNAAVTEFGEAGHHVNFLEKTAVSNDSEQAIANQNDAQLLFNEIENLL